MTPIAEGPLLSASSISKSFAGVKALENVSFDLRAGEVHALVGENGAGKSTFIKILTGALQPDGGTLHVSGEAVLPNSPARARSLGIAAIYQQPSLFPHLTVAENIGITLETPALWRRVDWEARTGRARNLLEKIGTEIHPERLVETLSMPEQQMVEIAKAIGSNARILIMDEPTASLTDREVDGLFRVIRTLRSEGVGIIYISHRLEEIAAIADIVTVLRDGKTIGTRTMAELDRSDLIRMMVGRELSAVFPKRTITLGEVVCDVRRLSNNATGIYDISLGIRAGEIVGLAGLVGSGRTKFAESLFGLTPADSGEVFMRDRRVHIASPADAVREGIAYVPEDRRRHGVVLEMPVAANTSLANLRSVSRRGLIDNAKETAIANAYVKRLRIKTSSVRAETASLSGGNQQKVAVARWLATRPSLLILDEPTQGVDIGSKAEIHRLMVELAEEGMAILMISSEMPEVLGMSDRIAVMHKGTIVRVLRREEATPQKVLALALGHDGSGMESLA